MKVEFSGFIAQLVNIQLVEDLGAYRFTTIFIVVRNLCLNETILIFN